MKSLSNSAVRGWVTIGIAGLVIVCGLWGIAALTASMARGSVVNTMVQTGSGVLPAGGSQRAVVKITLDAPKTLTNTDRPPVNLAIVLDRSGSMAGKKIQKAKEAAIEALRRLGPKDIFSVVVYDHNVRTVVPAQYVKNSEGIEARIRRIRPGGKTALFAGVSQGAAQIRKNIEEKYVHRIILLSDGIANVGPSSPNDLGRLGAALLKEGISVTTVGVGVDYNEDLMTRLSQKSDGNSYFVESSTDLPRIFAAELGDVLNVVAKKVRMIIECPEGVKPLRLVGRDGRIKGRTVELSMNQLYGGQEKYALLEVEVPKSKDGQTLEVAVAKISYDNALSGRRETSVGKTSVRFSKDTVEVKKSVNAKVQEAHVLTRNAMAQEAAISFADSGKPQAAVRRLNESAGELRKLGKKYDSGLLLKKAVKLEQQAETISKEGMTRKSRKDLRTDSFQMKNQQYAH